MYKITEWLDDDQMSSLITLASADKNYIGLEISKTENPEEGGYSVLALAFADSDDSVLGCFFVTNIFDEPYIPYQLSHVIRAELECRDLNVVEGLATTTYDSDYEIKSEDFTYLCSDSNTYGSICKSLKYRQETLH